MTHINKMSRLIFHKWCFCGRNCETNNFEIFPECSNSLVLIVSVVIIGTVYLSLFYVFWCHVQRAMQNVLPEFHDTTWKKPLHTVIA